MSSCRCLLVFTKPARPGRVKTRLIGELTAVETAALHAAFLSDLLSRLSDGRFAVRVLWKLAPDEDPPSIVAASFRQRGDDLGERLFHALQSALKEYPVAAAIGSDHPDLNLARIESGFAALEEGYDVVLGPAHDGGCYLIGAQSRGLHQGLFEDIVWSSDTVYSRIVQNARSLGLDIYSLGSAPDVDTAEDLVRLATDLALNPDLAPRTHRLLSSWGRLPAPAIKEATP